MHEIAASMRLKWLTFLRQWVKNPRSMASIAPSGKQLAQLMTAELPPGSRHVVEFGSGTGAITAALIASGIDPAMMLAIEMNPVLHELLQKRFPSLHVACGDASHLEALLGARDVFANAPIDAICSSLGLLTLSPELQFGIFTAAFKVLRPGGVFIQYTYGLSDPLEENVRNCLKLQCKAAGLAWKNLPPARVFVYSRS